VTDLLGLLLSLASWIVAPSRAICPVGWSVDGVRPSGRTHCVAPAFASPSNECTGSDPCDLSHVVPSIRLPIRIMCRPGQIAIVVDYRRIACRSIGAGA
jgi:hypothetical protein